MTDEVMAAIRERTEKATPGPWVAAGGTIFTADETEEVVDWVSHNRADVAFVAHSREDIPALLAEVERLRGRVHALNSENINLRELNDAQLYAAAETCKQLRAENAALREIAQAVAVYELVKLHIPAGHGFMPAYDVVAACRWCGHGDPHTDTCPVTKARALLAGEETR